MIKRMLLIILIFLILHFCFKLKQEMFSQNSYKIKYIHVGKTGGTTLNAFLKNNENSYYNYLDQIHIHVRKSVYDKYLHYIISIRCPINRCLSAINMYKTLALNDNKYYFNAGKQNWHQNFYNKHAKLLKKIFEKFTINEILENLENFSNDIHHIKEGISFYLNDEFINKNKNNILFVLKQETYNDDLKKLSDLLNIKHNNYKKLMVNKYKKDKDNEYISTKAIDNIIDYYKKDYYFIALFIKHNLVDKSYINILLSNKYLNNIQKEEIKRYLLI
jgi:hypothetical protein